MSKVPLEKYEAEFLANRLDNYWYRFSAIKNESDTHSWFKGKQRKKEGIRDGCPDFVLILKRWSICFIELKRQKPVLKSWKLWKSPSQVKPEQIEWNKELKQIPNCFAEICYWAEEAIMFIIQREAS
jgi:hypothetical protein